VPVITVAPPRWAAEAIAPAKATGSVALAAEPNRHGISRGAGGERPDRLALLGPLGAQARAAAQNRNGQLVEQARS
jgi:hypothetical protein